MDPLIVSLIFQGLRLAAQVATQGNRARTALSELEMFFIQLHEEDRSPTNEEMAHFTGKTAEIDQSFAGKLEALKAMIEARGEVAEPTPEPTPRPEPVPEPIPRPEPIPGQDTGEIVLETTEGEPPPE